ncbi:MAG: sce7726 family protein [Clostridia bacterium]|nr:sce7726 family protein [Clostridia bacterium]
MENGLYDRDIREPLYLFLEEKYGKIRIIEEKITGRARADAVMVTESALCGIEIKSDADTYARLPGQVREYDKYFDFNFAVVGLSHVSHIEEHLPSYWGIITAERIENGLDFYIMRRPTRNPHREMARKVSLLWRPEMESILVRTHRPSFRGYSKARVISRMPELFTEQELDRLVSDALFERDYTLIDGEIERFREEYGKKRSRRTGQKKRSGHA